jgi:hypothetical protein
MHRFYALIWFVQQVHTLHRHTSSHSFALSHLTLLRFAALQVPLGVLLTLHFMPRALLEELRARASGVTKTDYKVRICVFWAALWFVNRLVFHVGPALLLNDCASLNTLGFVTGRDATRQAMSRCGMVAVAAGKAFGIVHYKFEDWTYPWNLCDVEAVWVALTCFCIQTFLRKGGMELVDWLWQGAEGGV